MNFLFLLAKPFTLVAMLWSLPALAQVNGDIEADHNSAYAAMALELMGAYCKYDNTVQPFLESAKPNNARKYPGGFKLSIRSRTERDGYRAISYEFETDTKYMSFVKYYDADLVTSMRHPVYCSTRTKGIGIPKDPTGRR